MLVCTDFLSTAHVRPTAVTRHERWLEVEFNHRHVFRLPYEFIRDSCPTNFDKRHGERIFSISSGAHTFRLRTMAAMDASHQVRLVPQSVISSGQRTRVLFARAAAAKSRLSGTGAARPSLTRSGSLTRSRTRHQPPGMAHVDQICCAFLSTHFRSRAHTHAPEIMKTDRCTQQIITLE
jgi:DUF971 family protein